IHPIMASLLPPQQHSQPSRKGKKAWRKNVDVSDVQSGLDEIREEIIQGGTALASRDLADLFALDTKGDTHARLQYQRDHRLKKPLKSEEILAQRSAVPAVGSKKRPAQTTDGVLRTTKKQRGEGISYKELERLRKIAYAGTQGPSHEIGKPDLHERASKNELSDLWAAPAKEPATDAEKFDFLPKKKPTRAPNTIKRAPLALSASGKPVRSVAKPDPGRSYNPLFDDWTNLFDREGAKEVEKERQRLASEEREQERLARVAASAAEAERKEAEEDAYFTESEWEGFNSEHEEGEAKTVKASKLKSQAERNKINRRKEAERKAVHEKKMKQKDEQLRRVKAFAQEVREKEKARQEKLRQKGEISDEDSADEETLRRKSFGKSQIPDQPLELVLADELQESLRLLKPEGNILKDRFRSMIVRGKIESRKRISQHKKPQRKATEKWTYKDWKL
ncbi:P60-like protein, partial [Eremomyces bilateralis CBS 781.70]